MTKTILDRMAVMRAGVCHETHQRTQIHVTNAVRSGVTYSHIVWRRATLADWDLFGVISEELL